MRMRLCDLQEASDKGDHSLVVWSGFDTGLGGSL